MTRWLAGLGLALCLPAAALHAQNGVELRGAVTKDGSYRYTEFNHTFGNKIMADALYFGVPGSDEFYAGIGRVLTAKSLTVIPLVYGVIGRQSGERGVAAGLTVYGAVRGLNVTAFAGYFEPIRGDVPRYVFLDSLDLTRKRGAWEFGGSTGFFYTAGTWNPLVGPTIVRNDKAGAWRVSVRGGSHVEGRLIRTFAF